MNCEQVKTELPDFLAGSLNPPAQARVQDHLDACPDCSELAGLWDKLGAIPDELPSPRLRANFHEMLARETAAPKRAPAWIWQAVAAAVIAVMGFAAGRSIPREQSTELRDIRDMLALSLLQQQSASDRLKGISYTYQANKDDAQIRDALLEALNTDSSVDVRLAAVDALRRMSAQQGISDSLERPQSPLVQIALIDAVVELNETKSVAVLQKLQAASDVDELVKQRARQALGQLRSKGTL